MLPTADEAAQLAITFGLFVLAAMMYALAYRALSMYRSTGGGAGASASTRRRLVIVGALYAFMGTVDIVVVLMYVMPQAPAGQCVVACGPLDGGIGS